MGTGTWVILFVVYCEAVESLTVHPPPSFDYRLAKAALEVSAAHATRPPAYSEAPAVPGFYKHGELMHSYLAKTSIGDREELQVTKVTEAIVKTDLYGLARWTYLHHNHSDHLMAVTTNHVHLWRLTDRTADLRTSDTLFRFNSGSDSIVDALAFVRSEQNTQSMYLVLIVSGKSGAKLLAYLLDYTGHAVLLEAPLTDQPIKIRWLESQRQGALVLLIPSTRSNIHITDFRKGKCVLSHIVEVHVPNAVDIETMTIAGYGYIVAANASSVTVLRSDELANTFLIFDVLHGHALLDIAMFRVGFDSLLTLAGSKEQLLYVWRGGGFYLRQRFEVSGALQWHPLALGSCRDDVVLALATDNPSEPLKLFVWSAHPQRFSEVDRQIVQLHGFVVLKDSMASFSVKDSAWLLLTDKVKGVSRMVGVMTKVLMVPNPIQQAGSQLEDRMKNLKTRLDQQQVVLRQAIGTFNRAVKPGAANIAFSSPQALKNLLTKSPVSTGIAELPQGLSMEGSPATIDDLSVRIPDLQRAIGEVAFRLRRLASALTNAAFKNDSIHIYGKKVIKGAFAAPLIKSEASEVSIMGSKPTTEIFQNVYLLDKPRSMQGAVTLARTPVIKGSLKAGAVNGMNMMHAVTTNQHQTLRGRYSFQRPLHISKDSFLEGTLNGIRPSSMVKSIGNHFITAPKIFTGKLTVQGNLSSYKIDEVDLIEVAIRTLATHSDQVITGLTTFRNLRTTNVQAPVVNGLHVADLSTRFVRTDKPAKILGHKSFSHMFRTPIMTVEGTLDNLHIPHDLVLRDAEQFIRGRKHFRKLITKVAIADGLINGVIVPDDLVTLTSDELVPLPVTFTNGIHASTDIVVSGTVDTVDLSNYAKYAAKHPDQVLHSNVVFRKPVVVRKNLRSNMINSQLLDAIYNDAIFPGREKRVLNMTGRKEFAAGAKFLTLTIDGMVNGYNLLEDLMSVDEYQDIEGRKIFLHPANIKNINATSHIIDGVDMRALGQVITLSTDQFLTGEPTFIGKVTVGDLYVGRIQGLVVPRDVALTSSQQRITGPKHILKGVQAPSVDVLDELNAKVWSGVDIKGVYDNRLTLNTEQEIPEDFALGTIRASYMDAIFVNGINVKEFLASVMSKSTPQVVTGSKRFIALVRALKETITSSGVNGINLKELNEVAFKLRGSAPILASQNFQDTLTIEGPLIIGGLLNGGHLNKFEADTVPLAGQVLILGPTVFTRGFKVAGNVDADTVTDLILSYDVLLKSADQTIKGHYTFAQPLRVAGNLPHSGYVNQADLSELDLLVMKTDRENFLHSNIEMKKTAQVSTDVVTTGTINRIKVSVIRDEAVCSTGNAVIPGPKIVKGPVTFLDSLVGDQVNNVNLADFLKDVVLIDGNFVTVPKTFQGPVFLEGNIKTKGTVLGGLVNTMKFKDILDDAVRPGPHCDVEGTKVFSHPSEMHKPLQVGGFLNGLKFPEDLIKLCHTTACPTQVLNNPIFEALQVPGNLPVSNNINGQKLPLALANTMFRHANQTLPGPKQVQVAVFRQNVVPHTVNNYNFNQEVIPLNTNQQIRGHLQPQKAVVNKVNIKGFVNGINIPQLAKEVIYLNSPQTIPGPMELNRVVFRKHVLLHGTVNKIPLNQLYRDLSVFDASAFQLSAVMKHKIQEHEEVLSHLGCFMKNSYSRLDYFKVFQYLGVEATIVDFTVESRLRLVDVHPGDVQAVAYNFEWHMELERYVLAERTITDVGQNIIFSIGGVDIWIEEPIPDSKNKAAIVTNGKKVLTKLEEVRSVAALKVNDHEALIAVLSIEGVADVLLLTLNGEIESVGTVHPGPESTKISLMFLEGETYLVVVRHTPEMCITETLSSLVYMWDDSGHWIFLQTLYGGAVIQHFEKARDLYIVLADVDVTTKCNRPSVIKIYRSCVDKYPFELFQTISFPDVITFTVFEYGAELDVYMIAGNRSTVAVYYLQGASGFVQISSILVSDLSDLKVTSQDDTLYLVVSQSHAADKSIVFKAITKGAKSTFHQNKLS